MLASEVLAAGVPKMRTAVQPVAVAPALGRPMACQDVGDIEVSLEPFQNQRQVYRL